ncbi:MAG: filamentous hemagglutinin N-terminal domain-containing protein, partial [Verrucomicrobia bacterium]|nr:filamentous hemagglutinin N-terminal domain-containing protein [Verrucomicrobiota bacterium]
MKRNISRFLAAIPVFCLSWLPLHANPVGEHVVAGSAAFNRAGSALTINQATPRLIINWEDFSIGAGELTRFIQPNVNAAALNRVISASPTTIYGTLQANGSVYLINPNGILVGPGGVINTHNFLGTTLSATDESFLRGVGLTLRGSSTAGIDNQGAIQAIGGNIFLIARTVENSGSLTAARGTVGLAAGTEVILQQAGADRIAVLAGTPAGRDSKGVNNLGSIQAATAELKAAGGNIYALAINNGGVIRANTVVNQGGRILLRADGGRVVNSGTLDASGTRGGDVRVLGGQVALTGNAVVDVSGANGGGTALIGGDFQGKNPRVPNAQQTFVGRDATIKADATQRGNGGKVIVWSDQTTVFNGSLSARGGARGGNGGFAEVSGKQNLGFNGRANLSAPNGRAGTLLLDPGILNIEAVGTEDAELDVNVPAGDLAGQILAGHGGASTFTISAAKVVQSLDSQDTLLQAGISLNVNAAIDATPNANAHNLTLTAPTISLNAPITLQAGSALTLDSATAVTGNGLITAGTLNLNGAGSVGTLASPLNTAVSTLLLGTSGGNSFLNEADGLSLSGATGGGNLNLLDAGTTTLNAALNAGAGTVTLDGAVDGTGLLTADTLNLDGAGNVGSAGTRLNTTVGTLALNKPVSGDTFVNETDGLNVQGTTAGALNLQAGGTISQLAALTVGGTATFDVPVAGSDVLLASFANQFADVTITSARSVALRNAAATPGTLALPASLTDLTLRYDSASITLPSGGATVTGTLDVDAQGITTSADLAAGNVTLKTTTLDLNHNIGVGAGAVTIENSGALTVGSPATTITAGTLTLKGAGAVASGAQRLNTTVGALVLAKTGGSSFVNEADGLNLSGATGGGSLDLLDAGPTTLNSALSAGAGTVTLDGAVDGTGLLTADTLNLNGAGDVGALATRLNTAVNAMVLGKTAGNSFLSEADGLNLSGATGGGNLDLVDAGTTTLNAALTAGAGTVTLDGAVDGAGLLTAGTLNLNGAGDVGALAVRLNTAVNTLVLGKTGGNSFLSEADGLNLSGATGGGNLDLLDAGTTTLNAALSTGAGTVTLDGAVDGTGLLTADTLNLNGASDVGALATRLNTAVNTLVLAKTGGNSFLSEADGLNLSGNTADGNLDLLDAGTTTLNAALNAGVGTVTLDGAVAVTGPGHLTADTLNLTGNGHVGTLAARLGTTLNTLVLAKSGGDTFIGEADGVNLSGTTGGGDLDLADASTTLNAALNAGVGSVTLNGAVDGSGLLTADTLTLSGHGNVGASAARLNTAVNNLVLAKTFWSTFLSEADGLNLSGTISDGSLDLLDAGTTTLNAALNAGAGTVTLDGAVDGPGLLTADTLTLNGAGNVGTLATRLNTSVNNLVLGKTAGNSFLSEADGLNLSGATGGGNLDLVDAGTTTLNAALSAGAGTVALDGAVDGAALLTADTLNLNGAGDVGALATRLNTAVNTLVLGKTAGNSFLSEADGLNLSGATGGGNLDLVDAGTTTLNAALNAGAGTVTLGGAVDGAGLLTAATLNLNGAGNVG